MSKHKSPFAGKIPPPTPSAAVERVAEQIIRTTPFNPKLASPQFENMPDPNADVFKAVTDKLAAKIAEKDNERIEARAQEIVAERETAFNPNLAGPYGTEPHTVHEYNGPSTDQVVVPVPRPNQIVTIEFKFTVVDEGEIEYVAVFHNMDEANAWLSKVKTDGVTINAKDKPRAEWYSPYFIRKIVAKPILPQKEQLHQN